MLFSTYFNLISHQNGFEFFDINIFADTRRFVDPYCIQRDTSILGRTMVGTINTFMYELLSSVRKQQYAVSLDICSHFRETKGTRLGYSLKRVDGHGAGNKLSKDLVDSLYSSQAVTKGAVQYLEETALVCDGVNHDIISDITISIVKLQLIEFTQDMCAKYNIPTKLTKEDISYYCSSNKCWKKGKFELPHVYDAATQKESYIILIPERMVPVKPTYNVCYFYSNLAIPMYKEQAIRDNSIYVYYDRNGIAKVRSGDIRNDPQYGGQKPKMSSLINDNPNLLKRYRSEVAAYKYDKFR